MNLEAHIFPLLNNNNLKKYIFIHLANYLEKNQTHFNSKKYTAINYFSPDLHSFPLEQGPEQIGFPLVIPIKKQIKIK